MGIRNHLLALPTSVCATQAAVAITRSIPGTVAACHAYGCCQMGADAQLTFRTLLHTAANPNVGAMIVVGLGCEGLEPLAMFQQVMVFTTGRGTPAGNPVMPVIKVTANRRTAERMRENIDLDLSGILEGAMTIPEAGACIFDEILRVANGKPTKAELLGHTKFSITRVGPTF